MLEVAELAGELPPLDPPHSLADMDKVGVRARGIANEREDVLFMAVRVAMSAACSCQNASRSSSDLR